VTVNTVVQATLYSKITYINSPPFCVTTFSASLTDITALLLQQQDSRCYVSSRILTPPPHWLHEHFTSLTFPTCNISLVSLKLPTPEAGDFMELILLWLNAPLRWTIHCRVTPGANQMCSSFITS